MAIHEILETDGDLQRLIVGNPSRGELDAYMDDRSIRTLLSDGVSRAVSGDTTIEEVVRVVNN